MVHKMVILYNYSSWHSVLLLCSRIWIQSIVMMFFTSVKLTKKQCPRENISTPSRAGSCRYDDSISKLTIEVGGWGQVSLGIFLFKKL